MLGETGRTSGLVSHRCKTFGNLLHIDIAPVRRTLSGNFTLKTLKDDFYRYIYLYIYLSGWKCSFFPISYIYISRSTLTYRALYYGKIVTQASYIYIYIYIYIYNLSQASFRRHSLHNSINTVPQVKSKTICFSSLIYISAVLNGLHQGEWPLQASHTIITW